MFVLLIVELALLVLTLLLLLLSRREWKGRERLFNLLMATMRILTRQEYFSMVMDSLKSAKKNIHAIVTGTAPSEASRNLVDGVLQVMSETNKNGISLNYLLPKSPEKLEMGYLYTKAGAKVRYHDGLVVYDLRFMLIDEKYAVLGLPETTGATEPTRRGALLRSETLASVLLEYFNKFWGSAEDFNTYLTKEVLKLLEENPELSAETISLQFKVDVEEISKVIKAKK
jgi:hypothetical protein